MKEDNIFKWSDRKIYLIALVALTIILAFYQPIIAFISFLMVAYLVYYSVRKSQEKNRELIKYVEGLTDKFESAAKNAIFNMPFPLVIINESGSIVWYNTPFLDMIIGEEEIINERIYSLIPDFDLEKLMSKKDNEFLQIKYGDTYYEVYPNFVESKGDKEDVILYFVDNSNYIQLKDTYMDERTVVGLVYVDNFDDVKNNTLETKRPMLLAEIDNQIINYFSQYDGIVRKFENDKYQVVMYYKAFETIIEKKFDILDNIRELNMGNSIPITLSMGLCAECDNPYDSLINARTSIDIALGRGGDQAVVKTGNAFEFFGGKSKALEKRNKVRARVIGHALLQLIDQADNVFIMGHKNPDMDSLGSAIGLLRAVTNRSKDGYLIFNDNNPSITNLYNRVKEEEKEVYKQFISTEKALGLVEDNSLLIVVDNHKPSFTEAPEILNLIDKIVIIDHHRRGAEFIKNPVLTYLEPYASSTSELITEVISYMGDEISLSKFEAEALLAGITVDTKNFSFQTGVRTFEAASFLKRAGADTGAVRQLFRDNFDTTTRKAEVVQTSRVIYDNIAIGRLEDNEDDSVLVAAQAANELLNIKDVEASFVLTYKNDEVHISGRSLGNISVQLILEKLGGGGHLTSAGAQLDEDMEKAEEKLIEKIEEYLEEGDNK